MGSAVTLVVVALVILVGAFWAISAAGRRQGSQQKAVLADPHALRYQPRTGQDPATVMAALQHEGYVVSLDETSGGTPELHISMPDDRAPDREHVRQLLSGTQQVNFEGDTEARGRARFIDE